MPARVVTAMFLLRKLSGKSYELNPTRCQGTLSTSNDAEDDGSNQVVDQASEHVREGNYEKALWMLEKLGQLDPAVKGVAELMAVAEVSHAAVSRSCTCLSRENRNPDWYKILKVDEKSELSAIKKRYRHLALLLHPDKNKHVKAEAAFKLVSEAYACLSDKKKRANFNIKRSLTKCRRCSLKDCVSSESDSWSGCHAFKEKETSLQRAGSSPNLTQTDWILDQERLKIFRARARARVFGNLARVWKERGFTGAEEVTVGKERFCESKVKQAMTTSDQHQCKKTINETNKKREENSNTRPESSPVTMNNEMGKGSMGDMNHAMKASHQQLSRPYKNLGALIRDLRAELVSSIESTGDQKLKREDVLEQSPTGENMLETDTRDLGSRMQEGTETLSTMLGPRAEGDSAQHLSGSLREFLQNHATNAVQENFCTEGNSCSVPSAHSHSYPDGVLNDSVCASDMASRSCSNKRYSLCEKRRESFINFEKDESDSLIECETQQKNKGKDCSRTARKDEECASTISKSPNLCRRIGRGDSLDIEETILQTQKEKSEQLLKTLQRLREETKTVAASLDQFCSGRSY